jgi:hypothetical protein
MFENVNKIKLTEGFENTMSVKDWNEFSDGSVNIIFSDGRTEEFNYYDEEDPNGVLDYHVSAQEGDDVGFLSYINSNGNLIAQFEAITGTHSPDNPEWELSKLISVEPLNNVNEADYHQREDNESEPDTNSTYTLKDDNFERLQIDSVSRANNHENVNNGWKFIERRPSNNGSYSYHWRNTGNPDVQWTFGKQNVEKVVPMHQDSMIKEDVNNEVGTDSGIFQMLLAYVTKNSITEEEFQVGELTVQILANPTTWDDTPYIAASRMQPEEGGYPENVQGEISDIVIWDREDNEYKLSNDALQRLNQNVSFDGNLLDDMTQKAANGGEDEYSRADFARKDSMENEGSIKEDDVNDITRNYIDNIEGLSPERKAELIARQTAPQDNSSSNVEYIRMPTSNGLRGEEPKNRGERRSAGIGGDFSKNIKNKLKETSYTDLTKKTGVDMMEGIRFNYDQKGNWIPEGYEDKKVALRPLEQPLGSDNWKVALVTLDVNGDLDDIIKTTNTWEEAKNALHASIT